MSISKHEDSDGTGYCRGCGTTINEEHLPDCDLDEINMKADKDDGMSIEHVLVKIQREDMERNFRNFMENARNAMRAVKIAIEEGDDEEALRLIAEALGEDD